MIDAAITRVEVNRSVVIRFCSSIAFARSRSSRAIARFMKPISVSPSAQACREVVVRAFPEKCRWGGSDACLRTTGTQATIQEAGIVSTGAGMLAPHPLQLIV